MCSCVEGYGGMQCQHNVNECLYEPCINSGTCTNGINEHLCSCPIPGAQGNVWLPLKNSQILGRTTAYFRQLIFLSFNFVCIVCIVNNFNFSVPTQNMCSFINRFRKIFINIK